MNPLTYLGFTIFSVFMQFCVMELINERLQLDEDAAITSNVSAQKSNVLDKMKRNPHALFYRIESDQIIMKENNDAQLAKYSNSSLEGTETSTADVLSTTFEEAFFDENTSVTDDLFTTETYFAMTEFDNVTEITLLDKISTTTAKPHLTKKTAMNKKCFCNLLYKKCDINCCCDPDCSEEDRILFINCEKDGCKKLQIRNIHFCSSNPTCGNTIATGFFDDLFCVAKVNLPDQRVTSHFKLDNATINKTYKWKSAINHNIIHRYNKKKYEHGDTVWILKNDSIFPLYLPTTVANNYCSGKKQIKFLINESIKCNIKLDDLYVFSALNMIEGTNLISVTESTLNTTALNCSTLHCSNWTVFACNDVTCDDYNRTIHSPKCNKEYCSNLALKLEYIFYYSESRMSNASLKLYMKEITNTMPLLVQEISVKWYLGNESIDNTIQLSGNPGYISGLPIITSSAPNNHTSNFYNRTLKYSTNRIAFPINENGKCVWPSNINKTLMFGYNTRSKCRLRLQQKNIINKNGTSACLNIQSYIKESLGLSQKLFLSPYGNPQDMKDDSWIPLEVNDQVFLYGEHQFKETKLRCFNLVTRYAFEVAFADMSGKINQDENKIVKATVNVTPFNVTFEKADLSIVLTIDIRFIDISRPISEFAKSPHLNINLPKNFFYDYPSNKCYHSVSDIILVYLCSLIALNNK